MKLSQLVLLFVISLPKISKSSHLRFTTAFFASSIMDAFGIGVFEFHQNEIVYCEGFYDPFLSKLLEEVLDYVRGAGPFCEFNLLPILQPEATEAQNPRKLPTAPLEEEDQILHRNLGLFRANTQGTYIVHPRLTLWSRAAIQADTK